MALSLSSLLRMRLAYAGRFDADGRRLLFVSDLSGAPAVWRLAPGAWPELVAAPTDRAQTIHPGPRPGQLVVGYDAGGDERTQLLLIDRSGQRELTTERARIHTFGAWSSDGRRISYASNERAERWSDVYVRDLLSGTTSRVLEDDSTNRAGEFSPDGRWLLATRVFSNASHQLWLVDLAGSSPPRLLTSDPREARYEHAAWLPDGSGVVCLSDLGRETAAPAVVSIADGALGWLVDAGLEVDEVALSPDGRLLAYALDRDGAADVRVRELASGDEVALDGLPEGCLYDYWQGGLAWDRAGRKLAVSWTASRSNPDVWIFDARARRVRQATHAPRAGVAPARLVEPEHVSYPTFDGRAIPALFYAPRRRGSAPGPCVVVVHGGPEGQARPNFQPVIQFLVSAGLAVLAPNVRGSSGYGKTYLHLDDVRKRMDSVADLAAAARWLDASGRADAARIAVYGGSYGGFMVLAALTTDPELWAAGVDLVGIANFVTFLEKTAPWRRHLREAEYGSLERDRDFLEEISPIRRVDRVVAPLLVIHGANDPRVPIGEAEQIVARLRERGRVVEFLRLDDEGHQIAKLRNKLVAYPLAADFLRRHLAAGRGTVPVH